MIKSLRLLPSRAGIAAIALYQKTLSPDTGFFSVLFPHGFCRYYPTCSEYTKQAIESYGLVQGILRGTLRILRCNPLSRGGFDPVRKTDQKFEKPVSPVFSNKVDLV